MQAVVLVAGAQRLRCVSAVRFGDVSTCVFASYPKWVQEPREIPRRVFELLLRCRNCAANLSNLPCALCAARVGLLLARTGVQTRRSSFAGPAAEGKARLPGAGWVSVGAGAGKSTESTTWKADDGSVTWMLRGWLLVIRYAFL